MMPTLLLAIFALGGSSNSLEDRLDQAAKESIVDSLCQQLIDGYLYEDAAKRIAGTIREEFQQGAFDGANDPSTFASALTSKLQELSEDKHLRVESKGPASGSDQSRMRRRRRADPKDANWGFQRVEILEGNVGYIDLRMFFGSEKGLEKADAAMKLLDDVDALIIDLGRNGGGDADMVRYLSAYLFEEPTLLAETFQRGWEEPRERWTSESVRGRVRPDLPVFLLTSGRTFSAAESFTFGLMANHRVTVIGERTGGGGHFGGLVPLNHGLRMFLPRGRTYHPESGRGWEREGLKPDVEVPYQRALESALQRIDGGA